MSHSTLITDYLGTGTIASRPTAPNLPAGCLGVWLASDTGAASLWNGSVWQDIASLNTVVSGNGIAQTGSIFGSGTISLKVGAGLTFSSGTLVGGWQATAVTSLGTGLTNTAGVLSASSSSLTAGAGIVSVTSGTIVANYQATTVTAIGAGLTNTSGTLTATGSGGTVTNVATNNGVTGGPITGSGTIGLSTRGTISLMGNPGTAVAVPSDIAIGPGLTLSAVGTLSATGVASLTAGAGIVSVTSGTIVANYQAATAITAIGAGLSTTSGTLAATGVASLTAGAGIVSVTSGTIIADYQIGTVVSALGGSLINSSGTLQDRVGHGLVFNSGTIFDQNQGTITLIGATTGTLSPVGIDSALVNVGTANGTLAISPGFTGQRLRLEVKQGATAHTVSFDATVTYGLDVTGFTATGTANARDILQLICLNGTTWGVGAINHGFTI